MNYQIKDFVSDYVGAAEELAWQNYEEERRCVPESLPSVAGVPSLLPYAENGLGVAAFAGETLVGFLCTVPPFRHAFRSTDAVGVFSPLGANGAAAEERAAIYAWMYQAAGEKWAAAGASSHAVSLYAHDRETQLQFFRYGFGHRCMSAIRKIDDFDVETSGSDASFRELAPDEAPRALPLQHQLDAHMAQSPTFILRPLDTEAQYLAEARENGVRIFAAYIDGGIVAFLKLENNGETFLCGTPGYIHITGAFCLPEHRGKGIYAKLLHFAVQVLKKDGTIWLGVDCETINPDADRFWSSHFHVYDHSVTRRIDEHVFRRFK